MFKQILSSKWKLAFKVIPFILLIVLFKLLAHKYGLEFLGLSSLFTALVSANIFLIGFLVSGVLADYKESEKIPGDIAASLEVFIDENEIISQNKKAPITKEFKNYIKDLTKSILDWFCKNERTSGLMKKISGLNNYFLKFENLTQANFIVRLKQEQNNLRKIINRVHYVRETSFNAAGYAISEIITFILSLGLIFVKMEPFYENIFFVVFVPFILIYMIFLIKDLDNPFDYYGKCETADEVSLRPIQELHKRLK